MDVIYCSPFKQPNYEALEIWFDSLPRSYQPRVSVTLLSSISHIPLSPEAVMQLSLAVSTAEWNTLRVRTSLLRSQSSTLSQFSGIVFLSLFFQSSFFSFLFYMVVESITGKAMASHSSTLAWKIPWTEEPGGLQSMGSLRVGYD